MLVALSILSLQVAGATADPVEVRPLVDLAMQRVDVPPGDQGALLSLRVERAEPLTLLLECYELDLALQVEDLEGSVLARDEDSGRGTDARIEWMPPSAGEWRVRALARPPGPSNGPAKAFMAVVRGSMRPCGDEHFSERAYWILALARAESAGDTGRATRARSELEALDAVAEREALRSQDEERARQLAPLPEIESAARTALEARDARKASEELERCAVLLRAIPGGADDPRVAEAWGRFTQLASRAGATGLAVEGWRAYATHYARILSPDHPYLLLQAEAPLANALRRRGALEEALPLHERIVARCALLLPPEEPSFTSARQDLGAALAEAGRFDRARILFEDVYAHCAARLGQAHPVAARAAMNLANVLAELGRLEEAAALQADTLRALDASVPADDPARGLAVYNLANTYMRLSQPERARPLLEQLIAVMEQKVAADDRNLVDVREMLSGVLSLLGEHERAEELGREVLGARGRTQPPGSIEFAYARTNLAGILLRRGRPDEAVELQGQAVDTIATGLPDSHGVLRRARRDLARALRAVGRTEELVAVCQTMLAADARAAREAAFLPRRAAHGTLRSLGHDVPWLIHLARERPETREHVLDFIETRRAVVAGEAWALGAAGEDDEVGAMRAELARALERSAALVAGLRGGASERAAEELARVSLERDRLEARLLERLSARGAAPVALTGLTLARSAPHGAAQVGYIRHVDLPGQGDQSPDERFSACVVRAGEPSALIDLGRAEDIVSAVRAWRAAIGRAIGQPIGQPIEAGPVPTADAASPLLAAGPAPYPELPEHTLRGIAATSSSETDLERNAGEVLRSLVFDPLLSALGDAEEIHVCLDDVLYAVPLDALPLGGGVLGDVWRVVPKTSFAVRPAVAASTSTELDLLALGAVDYGVESTSSDAQSFGNLRFRPLPASGEEVCDLLTEFARRGRASQLLLQGRDASKGALVDAAARAGVLHIATHGWFAPLPPSSAARAAEVMNPAALCGLALAHANRPADATGRLEGMLTAEEIAGLELSRCELVVLSACETGAGIAWGGQGVHSLQSAFQEAGARATIASLWAVEDRSAEAVMSAFYRRLLAGEDKQRALWQAKQELREQGASTASWAGWVLCGDARPLPPVEAGASDTPIGSQR